MISETMPLNEWPVIMLKCLRMDLEQILRDDPKALSTLLIWDVVNQALKDAEQKEIELPFP